MFDSENGAESFVFAHEAEPDNAVPLSEVDWRRRVLRLYAHNTRLDLRRRLEAVFRYFDKMVYLRKQLHVD